MLITDMQMLSAKHQRATVKKLLKHLLEYVFRVQKEKPWGRHKPSCQNIKLSLHAFCPDLKDICLQNLQPTQSRARAKEAIAKPVETTALWHIESCRQAGMERGGHHLPGSQSGRRGTQLLHPRHSLED